MRLYQRQIFTVKLLCQKITLDATDGKGLSSETSWGNPKTTKAMIKAVKNAGFNTVRIPVSWGNHLDSKGK